MAFNKNCSNGMPAGMESDDDGGGGLDELKVEKRSFDDIESMLDPNGKVLEHRGCNAERGPQNEILRPKNKSRFAGSFDDGHEKRHCSNSFHENNRKSTHLKAFRSLNSDSLNLVYAANVISETHSHVVSIENSLFDTRRRFLRENIQTNEFDADNFKRVAFEIDDAVKAIDRLRDEIHLTASYFKTLKPFCDNSTKGDNIAAKKRLNKCCIKLLGAFSGIILVGVVCVYCRRK